MRKRWIAAASIILIMGSMMTSMAAEEKIQEEGESQQASVSDRQWQEDSGGWKYVNAAGEFKKNRWEEINGYWYYFDNDGYMVSDWTRIGGMNY
ncbi:MAG: hypothetical protein ACK5H4_03095 [Lacrimispora sphenoides]